MKKLFYRALLICFIFISIPLPSKAYDFMVGSLCYKLLTDSTVGVTYYSSLYDINGEHVSGNRSIPEKVTNDSKVYSITSIGYDAFHSCKRLTSVTIPNSVTSIGDDAFYYCCSLTSVTIPNSVTSIGNEAFEFCTGLTSVTIGNSVTSISYGAFYRCTGIKKVNYNAVSCKNPSSSSSRWFKDSPLTSLTIGDGVKSIPAYLAYNQMGITSLTIPGSVTSIGDSAFSGCSGVKYFYCNALTPPTLGSNCFPSRANIIVPWIAYTQYKSNSQWNAYNIIIGDAFGHIELGTNQGAGSFGGSGSGTANDPYLIFNPIHLYNVRNFTGYSDVYFKLMSDIDLSEFIADNSPTEGWEPIGLALSPFMGHFDGNNHTISGMKINRTMDNVGLFSCLSGAEIKNLIITGSTVEGNSRIGSIAGVSQNSKITGVTAQLNVKGSEFSAGLIGVSQAGDTIENCVFNGDVQCQGDYTGGFSASAYQQTISNSQVNSSIIQGGQYTAGAVGCGYTVVLNENKISCNHISGTNGTAGVIGYAYFSQSSLTNNSVIGNTLTGTSNTGGVIGYASGPITATNCYAFIDQIEGGEFTGGFAGRLTSSSTDINHCGAIAHVDGTQYVGGFAGSSFGTLNNLFAIGDIESTSSYVGGITGYLASNASLSNSYYSGNINANGNGVGGIVGYADGSTIAKNYSMGKINGTQSVGGIVGQVDGSATIKSNVAVGEVVNAINGDVGRIYGAIGSGTPTFGETGSSDSNRGLTTMRIISKGLQITPTDGYPHGTNIGKSLLKYKSTYQGINWDFTNDWTILETESLPYKSVQCDPPTINSATSGATTVTGNCVSGGVVCVSVAGKHYTAQVSGNTWTATVDPLPSGATVRAFATTGDKIQSYMVSSIVGYAGEGTEASPYLIYTASDLANINSYSYYKVMNDIDLTDWINANNPTTGWIPVGASGGGTMKQLDGHGKTITGLWFNRSNSYSGLFSTIENATVKNLTVKTASGKNSKGADYSGILVGKASNSQLTGIKVEGSVEGISYVGGIAGVAVGTSITSCVATSVTAGGNSYVGGIAGEINGDITKCSADVELTGADYIGGITGHTVGEISLSTSKGSVTTTDTVNCRAGGIVAVTSGNIINCYNSASINGGLYSGGIVGYTSAKVDNCYSCGNISAMKYGAGVAGYLDGANAAVSHCFAINDRIDVSDQVGVAMRVIGGFKNGAASPDTTNFANKAMVVSVNGVTQTIYDDLLEGKGVQLAALKQQATYTVQGWDFDSVWAIKEGEGFPYFRHLAEKVPVTSITLNKSADKLIVGGNLTLIATVAPSDATIKTVNWTSDNVDVATVNEDGLVTAVAVGTATITATATDGSNVSASCSVEVIENLNEEIAALNQLVASAEELYNNSTEGENIGQYAIGARAELLEVILDVKARISATMTTEEITECTNALNAAIELFESKKVTTTADTDISAYENIIYVEKAEASVGSTVTLSLKMNNNREVVGFQCDFYAPEGTEIAVDADGFEEINLSTERTTSKRTDFFGSATQQDGAMRILAASTSLLPFLGNEGEIATIKLNIGSDMEDGDYPLIIRNTVFSDADGNTFKVNYVKTTLKISSYTLGDANGDGEINIGDFTAIANYILGHPKDSFVLQAADTNQDGEITVGDLSKLIKLILNAGTSSAPTQAAPKATKVVLCDSVIY